jgi:hypothetical protein
MNNGGTRKLLRKNSKLSSDLIVKTKTYDHLTDDIEWLYEKVHLNPLNKRKDNYLLEQSFKEYALCYSLTTVDSVPMLGSIAWARPFFNGAVRILSRYCINPEYITCEFGKGIEGFKTGIRIDLVDHIDQQVKILSKQNYNNFFISREDKTRNGRRTKEILNQINKHSQHKWKMSDKKELVCPDPCNNSCWQWVIYNNIPLTEIRNKKN